MRYSKETTPIMCSLCVGDVKDYIDTYNKMEERVRVRVRVRVSIVRTTNREREKKKEEKEEETLTCWQVDAR